MPAILNDVQHSIHIPGFQNELGVKQVAGQWQIIGDWRGDIRALLGPQAKDTCRRAWPAVHGRPRRAHGQTAQCPRWPGRLPGTSSQGRATSNPTRVGASRLHPLRDIGDEVTDLVASALRECHPVLRMP
jgi:hypothetical protein